MSGAFTKKAIRGYLEELNDVLSGKGVRGEMTVYGGAALILAWQVREGTRDIDAVFKPPAAIREAAKKVANNEGLDDGWLNDAVKGYLSSKGEEKEKKALFELSHLSVHAPDPEYLLAMKLLAARTGESQEDTNDALFLIKKIGLKKPKEALNIVEDYYPKKRIETKTQFFIESLFEELNEN